MNGECRVYSVLEYTGVPTSHSGDMSLKNPVIQLKSQKPCLKSKTGLALKSELL